jgi:hypothetical protein
MALVDDIAAIDADPALSPDQKRREKYRLKSSSLYQAALPYVGQQYTFRGVTYRLIALSTSHQPLGGTLIEDCLYVAYTRSDVPGLQERVFVNPPVLTADKREALLEVVQTMLDDSGV